MGIYATAIFNARNYGKVQKGELGRLGAATAQTTNLINAGSNSSIDFVRNASNGVLNGVDDVGKAMGVANAASKVTNFASKAVNPLLCVASGIRVLNDDDQYSALVEETAAMGTMFASEKLYKTLVANPVTQNDIKTTTKWAGEIAETLSDFSKNLKGKNKYLGKALCIAADLGLVAVSIASFDLGKKVGKKLTGRDEQEQQDFYTSQMSGVNYMS